MGVEVFRGVTVSLYKNYDSTCIDIMCLRRLETFLVFFYQENC